jgi:MoxR-like ATPase
MERMVVTLRKLIEELRGRLFERDEVIEGAFCALLTGNHMLIIGPPGTAKSQLVHAVCKRIDGAHYFQWLLTKFTTPEEIFGAVSLKGLENDEYRRVIDGKIAEAHIAFLDEVFKASSSILNTLLTIMNERVFYNSTDVVQVPLISLFGASNELPSEEDELEALYDRFLLRYVVDYVKEDFRFLKMLNTEEIEDGVTSMTLDELIKCQSQVNEISIPQHVVKLVSRLRSELKRKGIVLSDRRYKQSISLLRSKAYLSGRDEVIESDLNILENVLWRDPGELGEIKATIYQLLHGYKDALRELLIQARELHSYSKRDWENEELGINANIEAQTKLRHILTKLDSMIDEFRERGKSTDEIARARTEIEHIQRETLDKLVSSNEEMV